MTATMLIFVAGKENNKRNKYECECVFIIVIALGGVVFLFRKYGRR